MDDNRILWITSRTKDLLKRMITDMEAGLSASVAFEMCLHDIDQLYKQACALEQTVPINHMLEPVSVDMCARFGLDALFGALKGNCTESDCRRAFWQVFRRATLPALDPIYARR